MVIQRLSDPDDPAPPDMHRIAASGFTGASRALPYMQTIRRAFDPNQLSGVKSHVGGPAAEASRGINARAYTVGKRIAFAEPAPSTGDAGSHPARLDRVTDRIGTEILADTRDPDQNAGAHAAPSSGRQLRDHGARPAAELAGEMLVDAGRLAWRSLRQQSTLRDAAQQAAGLRATRLGAVLSGGFARVNEMTGGAPARALARLRSSVDTFLDGPAPGHRSAVSGRAVAADRDSGARVEAVDHELVGQELSGLTQGGGEPLPDELLGRMSDLLDHDFGHVRVHTDAQAESTAALLNARAFTVGSDIYFGTGQWAPGTAGFERLLVHELTHVVQYDQGQLHGNPDGGMRVTDPGESTETEAKAAEGRAGTASNAASSPGAEHRPDTGRGAGSEPRHERQGGAAPGRGQVVSRGVIEWTVRKISPELADLINEGPMGMLTRLLEQGVRSLMVPITGVLNRAGGVVTQLIGSFNAALSFVEGLYADEPKCSAAFAAALDKLRSLASALVNNQAVNTVKSALGSVTGAIKKVSIAVLSPAFDAAKPVLGSAWTSIQALATKIAGWVQPIIKASSTAWNWVREKLGLAAGSAGGVLTWLTGVARSAWAKVSQKLGPVAGPLKVVTGALAAITPVGPVVALIKYGPKLVEAVQWLWQNRSNPDIIKKAHAEMGHTFLPALLTGVKGAGEAMQGAARWLVSTAGSLSQGLLGFLGSLTGVPLLGMAQGAVRVLASAATRLATWATGAFTSAAAALQAGVTRLVAFVRPYAGVLGSIGMALANPAMIPVIVTGRAWLALPECIKAPIIKLLLDAAIAVLSAMPSVPMFGPIWALVKNGVLGFLKGLAKAKPDTLVQVANKLAKIISGGSPAFLLGFVKGFATGVWEGLTDPFVLVWQAVKGLGSVVSWLGGLAAQAFGAPAPVEDRSSSTGEDTSAGDSESSSVTEQQAPAPVEPQAASTSGLPSRQELGDRVQSMKTELDPPVQQVTDDFMPAVEEAMRGSGEGMTLEQLIAKLGDMWAAVEAAIQGQAGKLADKMCEFFTREGAEGVLGEKVGWLAGTIAFEVLLTVLTAGAWQPVSAAGKALKAFARILDWTGEALGEAFKLLSRIGGFLLDALKGLGKLVGNAGGAIKGVLGALGDIGRKLVAFGEELLGRFGRGVAGEGAERAAKEGADKVVKEGAQDVADKVVKEGAQDVADKGLKKEGAQAAGEKASKEGSQEAGEQGGKHADELPTDAEKARVAALATVEAHGMDRLGLRSDQIVKSLKATFQPRYRWIKDFTRKNVGGLRYQLFLIASETPLGPTVNDADSQAPEGKQNPTTQKDKQGLQEAEEQGGKHTDGAGEQINNDRVMSGRSKDRFSPEEWNNLKPEEKEFINGYRDLKKQSVLSDAEIKAKHKDGYEYTNNGYFRHPDSGKYGSPTDRAKYKDAPTTGAGADEFESFAASEHLSKKDIKKQNQSRGRYRTATEEIDKIKNGEGKYKGLSDVEKKDLIDKQRQIQRNASNTLGEAAGEAYAERRLKSQGFEKLELPGYQPNNFDQVYYNPKTGEVVVVECKGGGSDLGSRFGRDGATRVEQGTQEYLKAVNRKLRDATIKDESGKIVVDKLSGKPERPYRDTFGKVRRSLQMDKNLRYMEVRQPINPDGSLGDVIVKEFEIFQ